MDTTARWYEGIGVMEEKKAVKPEALNCPRCNSSNTKFCYYNNYNLLQPRYFCKTCRRYWTAGGSLRNVPVGGGSRKNKRSKINHPHDHMMAMPQPSSSNLVSQNPNQHIIQNTHGDGQDRQLMGFYKSGENVHYARGIMMMSSFMPSNTIMMNTCNLNGFENDDQDNNNNNSGIISTTTTAPSTSARLFFPLEDLKPPSASTGENEMQGESNCNAYWS